MTTYQLKIQFSSDGLKTLYAANQFVTLVKSVRTGVPVAWVSFRPMLNNVVTWNEAYSVYASTTQIQDGTEIITQSTQSAAGGNMYVLSGGQFDSGTPSLPPTKYGVRNTDPEFVVDGIKMVTSGLYQGAYVNGTGTAGAINAVSVPYMDDALFTPIEKVQVFASNFQNNGLVISSVTSQALEVDLTTLTQQSLIYSGATNRFTLAA